MPTRIIIADDEPLQRMALKDLLIEQGYLVIGEARDGLSAVELAREKQPDIVIMDIRMPVMDGITAAETLNREKIAPVVLLSALSDSHSVQRATDAGVVNFMIKPLSDCKIAPALEITLARYQAFRAVEERTRAFLRILNYEQNHQH